MKCNAIFFIAILVTHNSLVSVEIMNRHHHKAMIEELFDSLLSPKNNSAQSKEMTIDYMLQAEACIKEKKIDNAIQYYRKAIEYDPLCKQAHYAIGQAFLENNQFDEALESFKIVTSLDENNSDAYLNIAKIYVKKNDPTNAKEYFKHVINLNNTHKEALSELARILCDEQQYGESIQLLEKLQSLHPDDATVLFQLANTLNTAHYIDESLIIYNYLHNKYPQSSAITYNIAYTLKKLGRIDEALTFYDKTLILSPEHAEAHFSRGLAYLSIGQFREGWEEYEWRWKRDTQGMDKRNLSKPLWDGSDLHGKILLLHAEQGLGDTFQFIRYAKTARDKGATVIAAVQSPLVEILSLCPYIDRVISLTNPLPHFDVHAPLLSVPHILQTVEATIPCDIPYLYAHAQLVDYWREKLSTDKNFKIGICWQGNPNYNTPFLRAVVAAKSIKLKQFEPLFTIEGISIYNLQKMTGEEQLNDIPTTWNLINFDENFDKIHGRFMDTAAVIKNLDLIITVDTGLAHIAAGLGAQVWTFIPNPPDWRWMLERTDTPWYPNMTLFRQSKPGDWDSVIQEIAQKLRALIDEKNNKFSQKTVGDIVDMFVKTTVKNMFYGTKNSHNQEIDDIQREIIKRNIDPLIMATIKEHALELGKAHSEMISISTEIQKHHDPFDQEYKALTQRYCDLSLTCESIKDAINQCCN